MESETYNALKQAADLIRAGDKKAARAILIYILRDEPDNAQAWFMLSYAVPNKDKQIYALQQTLRLVPDYEKALRRLKKLGGEPPSPTPSESPKAKEKRTPREPIPQVELGAESEEEEDLLSQRLFDAPEKETKPKSSGESKPVAPFFDDDQDAMDYSGYYEEDQKKSVVDSLKKLQQDIAENEAIRPIDAFLEKMIARIRRLLSRVPPQVFFIGLFVIVLAVLGAIYGPGIIQSVTSSRVAQVIRENLGIGDSPVETLVPTPTENLPTRTPNPSPTPVEIRLFNTSDLVPASDAVLSDMEGVIAGINAMTGTAPGSTPDLYPLSETRLQDFAWDFAQMDDYEQQVDNTQLVFQILGVARNTDDFTTFYQNTWIDPNGTLYHPTERFIAVVGFEFSNYQKISFSQAYVQSVRNQQTSFADIGLFPPCISPLETCDIHMALPKGEAAFTAWEWARQTFDEATMNELEEANIKLYSAPVLSPTPLMEDLRRFPYEQGKAFVEQIYASGGWATVQSLYINLPQSTEQILHPAKYLQGETGASVTYTPMETVLPDTWQVLLAGPLGEWKTYLIFKDSIYPNARLAHETAQSAATGWNGDYVQVLVDESGKTLLVGHWKWDSPAEAAEFETVLRNYTAIRIGGLETNIAGYSCVQSISETSCVIAREQDVLWFMTQDADLLASVIESYAFLNAE